MYRWCTCRRRGGSAAWGRQVDGQAVLAGDVNAFVYSKRRTVTEDQVHVADDFDAGIDGHLACDDVPFRCADLTPCRRLVADGSII